jgi:hypothetical protein
MLTALDNGHNTNLAKHAEMLGHARLRDLHARNDIVHCPLIAIVKKTNDLPPSRLRDGIENIGSRRCSGHKTLYIPISEYMSRRIALLALGKSHID